MLSSRSAAKLVSLVVLLTVTACATPNGKSLEQMLAADSRLKDNPVTFGTPSASPPPAGVNNSSTSTPIGMAQLPADFPKELIYPNAQLQSVTPQSLSTPDNNSASASISGRTVWFTSDPLNLVQSFYQKEFQANNWDLNPSLADAQAGTIEARRNDLQVTISIAPGTAPTAEPSPTPSPTPANTGANPQVGTELIIQYQRNTTPTATAPQPGDAGVDFSSPIPNTPSPATTNSNADINTAPQDLQRYITDLAALGVLPVPTAAKSNQADLVTQFNPSKIISRREFARWLVSANNQIYANRPSLQIRAASPSSQPAFRDIPSTDPDFPVIQGLAEAGLIPSSLSGDATAVLFRPDAPLTREQLILWKVPLDIRASLPNASVDAVRESWGFQDIARIDPKALRAVLADFQNGEQSNIRRVFGYTTLFQPKKPVTRAEAAASIWYFGNASEGVNAQEALQLKQQPPQATTTPQSTPTP